MKSFLILCTLIFALFVSNSLQARIIHVPADSSTIQGGINGAVDGDTVLVARGHYYERINFLGKGILVASSFIFDKDTNTVDSTIIDADVRIIGTSDKGSVVCFVSGEDLSSNISGFTIRNGSGLRYGEYSYGGGIICLLSCPRIGYNKIVNNSAQYGGGVCCLSGDSSLLIIGNRFAENHAEVGGAILCQSSSALIVDNVFFSNHSDRKGGAIFFKMCSPHIINNYLEKNTTDGHGGGICAYSGSPTVLKNKIVQNTCRTKGGGLYCATLFSTTISHNLFCKNSAENGGGIYTVNCSSLILNNTVVKNSSTDNGGGILCSGAVYHTTIINNIVCLNTAGEGIRCDNNSNPFISFNDVWNNASGNFHGCPAGVGDTTWGTNFNGTPCDSFFNIVREPLFADTIDFELLCNSPCIDAGDPGIYVPSDSGGCKVDMGAHEYPYVLGDANCDGTITPKEPRVGAVTVGDVVFIINYLFRSGPAPCPYHSADTNCDGEVNAADVVCLINYLFRGGDLPCQNGWAMWWKCAEPVVAEILLQRKIGRLGLK